MTCNCPEHSDRVDCIDLRYAGYSPGPNSRLPPEERDECGCGCHAEREERDEDEERGGVMPEPLKIPRSAAEVSSVAELLVELEALRNRVAKLEAERKRMVPSSMVHHLAALLADCRSWIRDVPVEPLVDCNDEDHSEPIHRKRDALLARIDEVLQ